MLEKGLVVGDGPILGKGAYGVTHLSKSSFTGEYYAVSAPCRFFAGLGCPVSSAYYPHLMRFTLHLILSPRRITFLELVPRTKKRPNEHTNKTTQNTGEGYSQGPHLQEEIHPHRTGRGRHARPYEAPLHRASLRGSPGEVQHYHVQCCLQWCGWLLLVLHRLGMDWFGLEKGDRPSSPHRKFYFVLDFSLVVEKILTTYYVDDFASCLSLTHTHSRSLSQDDCRVALVMEFAAGGELLFRIRKRRRLPDTEAKFYAAEIADALRYMHNEVGFAFVESLKHASIDCITQTVSADLDFW